MNIILVLLNIGVAKNAKYLVQNLPTLKGNLPSITITKKFTKTNFKNNEEKEQFSWQEDSYQLAKKLKEKTLVHGFFGINRQR